MTFQPIHRADNAILHQFAPEVNTDYSPRISRISRIFNAGNYLFSIPCFATAQRLRASRLRNYPDLSVLSVKSVVPLSYPG